MNRTGNLSIVPQQQIKKIAAMSEEELYQLLKEIIGTKYYDRKKEESYEILEKTQVEEDKSEKVLNEFKGKIDDLKGDKESWEAYQAESKIAGKITYCLYQNKVKKTKEKIEEVILGSKSLRKKVKHEKEKLEDQEKSLRVEEKKKAQFQEEITLLSKEIQTLKQELSAFEAIFAQNEELSNQKELLEHQNKIDLETAEYLLEFQQKFPTPSSL